MGRLARWRGIVGLALRRLWRRATETAPRQVGFTVSGIALPVALLVVVTSVSLGLAAGGTVQSPDVDYWIVPESGASSPVVSVGGPRFGDVHAVGDRLTARDDVDYATPVLVELVRAESTSASEYVIAIGVVPGETPVEVAGASTAGLAPGDPHYAGGSYDGPRTDEAVLSAGAASLLDAEGGAEIDVAVSGDRRTLTVANVSAAGAGGGNFPVVLLRLSELQALTGATGGDQADQFLVVTRDPGVRPVLAGVYPNSLVLERGGIAAEQVLDSSMALAVGLAALAVALIVGTLSAGTTLGLSVAASSRERGLLAALGVSRRSRSAMVATEALAVSLVGGAVGVAVGFAGVPAANRLATRFVADVTVARPRPELAAYGLGVALLIGLLVVPYLLVVDRRTGSIESLTE